MAIETTEGDFIIRSGNPGCAPLLRIEMTSESMIFTASEPTMQRQVIIADFSEAKELLDWLTRRLDEPLR